MEIGIIIATITLIIAVLSYLKMFNPSPESIDDDRNALIVKYKMVQSIHLETQELIKQYIQKNNARNHPMMQGFTFGQYLEALERGFESSNSDKILKNMLPTCNNKAAIELYHHELDKQFQGLNPIHKKMKEIILR